MNPATPPGIRAMAAASWCEKPDWVSAQDMAVAVPMMSRMEPDRVAACTRMAPASRHGMRR